MNNELFKKFIPHLVAFVVLLVVTLAYFYPTLEGKVVQQSDIINYQGMSQEIKSYREKTGESTLWTNSMFGGMPAYQIEMPPNNNPLNMVRTGMLNFIPRTAAMILWAMVGFYVLMLVLGASPWVAMVGALGFGFSTYNVLIIDAGHVTKMLAMSTMPAVLAGVVLTYRRNLLAGAALTGFAFASNILSNHYQITYYLLMMLGIYVLAELVDAVRNKRLAHFAKASVILALVFALGIGTDLSRILTTAEYSKETTRGGSALGNDSQSGEKGLGRDYAFAWSSGVLETMTLIVPRFMGGSSNELLSENSEAKQLIRQDRGPTYWGAMPFTGGPVYFGAIICFLFILGCFVVKGPTKWWIIAATLVSIMLSWGKNFPMLNNLLFDYLPGYNKFRTVSMILVIAQLTMPLMGCLALHQIVSKKINKDEALKALKLSTGIVGGLLLILGIVGGGLFEFSGAADENYREKYPQLITALFSDRQSMLQSDSFRSLFLVLAAAALIWALVQNKLKESLALGIMAVLVLGDLWTVDKKYLNEENFVTKSNSTAAFELTAADQQILQDKDPNYRVFNTTRNPFNDAITSYHHKSIGGYHGAKLSRYQDLIENHLSKQNMAAINMLNTKYVIMGQEGGEPRAQLNPGALGNAWFVDSIKWVASAKEENDALNQFNPRKTAIVDKQFEAKLGGLQTQANDSVATIRLTDYKPNHLTYEANNTKDGLAVFSEIYYNDHKGWEALIDGKPADHIRANYVLRAMKVPAGKHKIEFVFDSKSFAMGQKVSLGSSVALLLLIIGALAMPFVERKK